MEELLNQTCRIYRTPTESNDGYGQITWGGFDLVICRFVKTAKHYKNSDGNDVNIVCKFQVSERSAEIGTKIEFNSLFYIVVDVKEWRGEDGELFGCICHCSNYPFK